MAKIKISVTEAARNFADCVNRALYQETSFVLMKSGKPAAELVPHGEKVCLGRDAAKALAEVRLTREEVRAWKRDLKAARKMLKPPVNRWR